MIPTILLYFLDGLVDLTTELFSNLYYMNKLLPNLPMEIVNKILK